MGRATVVLVLALPLCAGAAFLQMRYGWALGGPAYAVASFVACSRVESKRHYTSDVVAGAAIGIGMNHAHRGRAHREGLLPRHHEVEEDPVWGATFRDPTAVQPPRVVRLGARFDS